MVGTVTLLVATHRVLTWVTAALRLSATNAERKAPPAAHVSSNARCDRVLSQDVQGGVGDVFPKRCKPINLTKVVGIRVRLESSSRENFHNSFTIRLASPLLASLLIAATS